MPRTDSEPVRGNCQRRMLTVDLDSQAVTNETPSNHTEVPHSRCAFHGPTFKRERDGGGGYGVYLAHSISHHYSARKSLTVGGVSLVRPLPVTGWTTCHRLAARRDCTFIIASMISGRETSPTWRKKGGSRPRGTMQQAPSFSYASQIRVMQNLLRQDGR